MRWPGRASALSAALIVAVWIIVGLRASRELLVVPNQSLLRFGGVTAETLGRGEWWRLITSQFLHVYFLHALLNAGAILVIGSMVERAFGTARWICAFLVAGTCGQLVAVVIAPSIVATGASQAALGLSAVALVAAARVRSPRLALAPAIYLAIQMGLDLAFAQQIKSPHVASFIIGLVLGFLCQTEVPNVKR